MYFKTLFVLQISFVARFVMMIIVIRDLNIVFKRRFYRIYTV